MTTHATDGEPAAAAAAFSEWASRQRGAPAHPAALVRAIEPSDEYLGYLSTEIHGRRAVWREVPASSRLRVSPPSLSLDGVDAWSANAASVRERSDHVAICGECDGAKSVTCFTCNGHAKIVCRDCHGKRKAYGYASNGSYRLMNCTGCRGRGEVDCPHCHRGLATCARCQGEGRLQRWIEIETWSRSAAARHPEALARQLAWPEELSNEAMTRDAHLVADVDRLHRIAAEDLGAIPPRWLEILSPELEAGERVARQRLRIARLPLFTVAYAAGGDEDRALFVGRRLHPPAEGARNAFTRRAATLRLARNALLITAVCVAIVLFGRGAFYRSTLTLLGFLAFAGTLAAMYGGVAEWTSTRRMRPWLIGIAATLLVGAALTAAALPRLGHAQRAIAAGELDDAELELAALGEKSTPDAWADLRLARLAQTRDLGLALGFAAQIPASMPQHGEAVAQIERLSLGIVKEEVAREDWPAAAQTIASVREAGVPATTFAPLSAALLSAAQKAIVAADDEESARRRLDERLKAEAILAAWEQATNNSGTPALVALRTAMAHDVAELERPSRRGRS